MKISVIIPVYNEASTIGECIESIQAQTFPAHEIIIVDNNSTDGSGQIAEKLGVKVVKETKKGVSFARLAGFKQATGDILAFTDGDCVAEVNWLSNIAKSFTDEYVIALSGRVYFIGKELQEFLYHDNFYWKIVHPFTTKVGRPLFWGANFAARKSSLKSEYFPTHLVAYSDQKTGRMIAKNKKRNEKIIYNSKAKIFTYDTPSHMPKRNPFDHFLAEFGIYRKKIKQK